MRSSTFAGSCPPTSVDAHGRAAVVAVEPIVIAVAAMVASMLCAIVASGPLVAYVPGAFALSGSPNPEVARIMNCALVFAQAGISSAKAFLPFARIAVGMPVASERSPR